MNAIKGKPILQNNLEDYYPVTTFLSVSIGPLNKRQTKIRDHFIRTMEFLGLADVDVNALTKEQRDEILALAAKRRKELDLANGRPNPVAESGSPNNKERDASPNKRQWDIRNGLNIKLYKAIDALNLVIHDVEVLTQEQRGFIYAELKRQEKAKKSAGQPLESSHPSEGYENLEKIYTSKPEPFVDVSSLLALVTDAAPQQTKSQTKPTIRPVRKLHGTIGLPSEPTKPPIAKPKAKETRKPTALCPKPYKRTYATKEIARTFIDKEFPNDKTIAPYLCPCGAIHIGH